MKTVDGVLVANISLPAVPLRTDDVESSTFYFSVISRVMFTVSTDKYQFCCVLTLLKLERK